MFKTKNTIQIFTREIYYSSRSSLNITNFSFREYLNDSRYKFDLNFDTRMYIGMYPQVSQSRIATATEKTPFPLYIATSQTLTSHSLPCWWRVSRWPTTIPGSAGCRSTCRWLICALRLRSYLELKAQCGQLKDGALPHSYSKCRFRMYAFL